jgi:hypothetical protein
MTGPEVRHSPLERVSSDRRQVGSRMTTGRRKDFVHFHRIAGFVRRRIAPWCAVQTGTRKRLEYHNGVVIWRERENGSLELGEGWRAAIT